MKNYFVLLLLIFIAHPTAFCWTYSNYKNYPTRQYKTTNVGKMTPYQARQLQRLHQQRQINKIRRLNAIKKSLNDIKNGTLTGYSVPINSDIYKQMGIAPYSYNSVIQPNSINCKTKLFSNPQGNEIYFDDGRYYKNLSETDGKVGVTILYD